MLCPSLPPNLFSFLEISTLFQTEFSVNLQLARKNSLLCSSKGFRLKSRVEQEKVNWFLVKESVRFLLVAFIKPECYESNCLHADLVTGWRTDYGQILAEIVGPVILQKEEKVHLIFTQIYETILGPFSQRTFLTLLYFPICCSQQLL